MQGCSLFIHACALCLENMCIVCCSSWGHHLSAKDIQESGLVWIGQLWDFHKRVCCYRKYVQKNIQECSRSSRLQSYNEALCNLGDTQKKEHIRDYRHEGVWLIYLTAYSCLIQRFEPFLRPLDSFLLWTPPCLIYLPFYFLSFCALHSTDITPETKETSRGYV